MNNSEWTPADDAVACLLPMSARNNRILHIDGDSFFASCEIALDSKLEGRPVWVGGGRRGDGIVIAANRIAKKYGIKTGTACFEAKRLCPSGVLCKPHYDAYRELSRQMFKILEEYAPTLVPYSIDEGFLDFSTMDEHIWRNTTPTDYVQGIRQRIQKEVRLPVTAGLANSAKLAKLATDAAKGVGFLEVPAGQEREFLKDRPVSEMSGIGKNRQRSLAAFGAFTFGHVAQLPSMLLKQKFGIWGQQLWLFANGQWNEPLVLEIKDRTTISSSTTLPQDEHDYEAALTFMLSESTRLTGQLRREQMQAREFSVAVRFTNFTEIGTSFRFKHPQFLNSVINEVLEAMFREIMAGQRLPVRQIRIAMFNLERLDTHPTLWGRTNEERWGALDDATHELNQKLGKAALMTGAQLALRNIDESQKQPKAKCPFTPQREMITKLWGSEGPAKTVQGSFFED